MESHLPSPAFFWRSCGEPPAAWFLVGMPLALLALDNGSSLGAAMARLLAVLLVAALIWARGLGPGGAWHERLFVCAWAATWAGALGAAVTGAAWAASGAGLAGLFAALLVGAGWLGWASHARHELRLAMTRSPLPRRSEKTPASGTAVVTAWLLAALVSGLALSSGQAHWGDAIALSVALGLFTAFQRGHLQPPVPLKSAAD